jgi:hypothetical protein
MESLKKILDFFEKMRNFPFLISLTLILTPICLYFIYIALFGVNVVYFDEFEHVVDLQRIFNNNLPFFNIFHQHNETRMFFPRIVYLSLAYVSHFNTLFIMYCSAIIVCINLVLIFLIYAQKFGTSLTSLMKFIPVAWLMFILSQWENTLWGFQICIYLCIFGFLLSLYALQKSTTTDKWFVIAVICGIISIFSFFNGFVVLIIGLIVISTKNERIKMGTVWIVSFLVISAIYFYGWIKTTSSDYFLILHQPLEFMKFFFMNIGSSISFNSISALIMGLFIFGSILILSVLLLKRDTFRNNIAFFSLVLFSLGTSFSISLGRAQWTLGQAIVSRYTSFTILGIIGLYLLLISLYNQKFTVNKILNFFCIIVILGICIGILLGNVNGIHNGEKIRNERIIMADELKNYNSIPDEKLKRIYPWPNELKKRAQFLENMSYNVFAENS